MIKEIINWAPPKIKNCLVKILKLNFKDKPPYDELLTTLEDCFINEIIDEEEKYDQIEGIDGSVESFSDYKFEWNRNMNLHKEKNQLLLRSCARMDKSCKSKVAARSILLSQKSSIQSVNKSSFRNLSSMNSSIFDNSNKSVDKNENFDQ